MAQPVQGRFRRSALRLLRVILGVAIVLTLLAVLTLAGLRWHGIPRFLQDQLESSFRAHGWDVHAGKIRLRGRVLVGEQVRITSAQRDFRAALEVGHAEATLSSAALKAGRVEFSDLLLRDGRLGLQLAASNAPARHVSLDQIDTHLAFPRPDQVDVERLTGRFLGLDLRITSSITNASALRQWRLPPSAAGQPDWRAQVDTLLHHAESVRISQPSSLELDLRGDARNPDSLQLDLRVRTPQMTSSLGAIESMDLHATAMRSPSGPGLWDFHTRTRLGRAVAQGFELGRVEWSANGLVSRTNGILQHMASELRLASVRTPWLTNDALALSTSTRREPGGGWRTELNLALSQTSAPWASSSTNHLAAELTHELADWRTGQGRWTLHTGPVRTQWGALGEARLSGQFSPALAYAQWRPVDASWGCWANVEPFDLTWDCEFLDVKSPQLEVSRAALSGRWHAPDLTIERLDAELYGGHLESSASVDVLTRDLHSRTEFSVDLKQASPLLTPAARKWLTQFAWKTPPQVSADARLVLPDWTEPNPKWREDVLPTVQLAGSFIAPDGSFRGLPVASAHSHFSLSNGIWRLPDLVISRAEGDASLEYTGDMRTHEFQWRASGRMDPRALKPLFPQPAAQRVFDDFTFTSPAVIEGEVHGFWDNLDELTAQGRLLVTNFTFRGETCDHLSTALLLTNNLLRFSDTRVRQGSQDILAPAGAFDLVERVVYVTNAITHMDPDLVVRVIGPKVRAALRPYRFQSPPTVLVNGRLPTSDIADADVRFKVQGDQFNYWKLNVSNVVGDVYWRGENLWITNVQARFYGGKLSWHGEFDFSVPIGAQLRFEGTARNADLRGLMTDLGRKTNRLEGSLNGRLTVTDANSDDWRSWQGAGWLRLRDGYLWDIPIFGFFSPVLNTIVPGLGHSPISAGDASFTIDRSIVRTRDLELRSPALRLRYNGSVDFKGAVDARMQAKILRDTWGVGRVVSFAFWPIAKAFEYRIRGTIDQPKSEPLYIPKALLWPLHPFRTLRQLFQQRPTESPLPTHDSEVEPAVD